MLTDANDPLYQNTKIGVFDQITVVSQKKINDKLRYDWNLDADLSSLNYTDGPDNDPNAYIKAELSPGSVQLIGQSGGTELYFLLNFKSGTFFYYGGHHNSVETYVKMGKWVIAFKVSLDMQTIDKLPDSLQKQI